MEPRCVLLVLRSWLESRGHSDRTANPVNSVTFEYCEWYLAPRFHLPSEGADLHQTGNPGGWFGSSMALFLSHCALCAVDELDTRHGPLSDAEITGHRAGGRP